MHRRHPGVCIQRIALCLLAGLGFAAGGAATAQGEEVDGTELLNYAFASQLGSGIYQVSGRTVQVYQIPFYVPLRLVADRPPGLRVTLPVCFGFYDLNPGDVEDTDLPDDVATASFVPGIAVEFPVRANWSLEPFAEFGLAQDFHEKERVYVYAGGVKSLLRFRPRGLDLRVGNRLLFVGEHTPGVELDEDFAMFESGLEVRRPLRFKVKGHELDWGPFVMSYLYLEPTEVLVKEQPLEIGSQYELGFTLGTRTPLRLWNFKLPRVGLGYRFGDGISAIRLVLGAAF